MAVRTITLTTEAYDSLASLKREGESFSELVRRLTGPRVLLTPFAGLWSGVPKTKIDEIRKFLKDSDRLSKGKLRRLARLDVEHGQSR